MKNLSRRKRVCSGKSEEFMTEQEKYMKAALKHGAKGGGRRRTCRSARWLSATAKLSDADATAGKQRKNALHHAEIEAIEKACKKLGGWRLHRCDLYVTLEPCPMCAGALINSRMKTRVLRCARPEGRFVRLADKSVRTAVQSSARAGERRAGAGMRGHSAEFLPRTAQKAERDPQIREITRRRTIMTLDYSM